MPVPVAVGVDCADRAHVIHAEAPGFAPLRLQIPNDLTGFLALLEQLRQHFQDAVFGFALENPALLIAQFLLHSGFEVYSCNPRAIAHLRKGLAASGKKDDPLDAKCLCWWLQRQRAELLPLRPSSPNATLLAGWVRQRVDVVEEKNRILNQLTAALKAYYPRALELFANLEQPLTLAFLKAFPTPTTLAEAPLAEWRALFRGRRYPRPWLINDLWQQAQSAQVPVPLAEETQRSREVARLIAALELYLRELAELEVLIEQCFEPLPEAETFRSVPGAAQVLAPALCVLFGEDRDRWRDWQHLAQMAGTVPVTKTSGNSRQVSMRYHCDRRARRTLHLFAQASRTKCAWAREFYQAQRTKGKSYCTAIRNLATKWLRILFRLWKEGLTYDEALYLKNRSQRQQPRAEGDPLQRRGTGGGRTPAVSSAGAGPASPPHAVGVAAAASEGAR